MTCMSHFNRLLIVDDDQALRDRLSLVLSKKGFVIVTADTLSSAKKCLKINEPEVILLDLKLEDGWGVDLIAEAKAQNPEIRIVVFTGYGNIASAVAALKHGAFNYLAKPADIVTIERALRNISDDTLPPPEPMSPARAKWEHINRIYNECKI